jgi:hypothetical protein
MFYVYAHSTPNAGIFYIGKGSGSRAQSKAGRNNKWKEIVQENGGTFEYKIIANGFDSEEKAYAAEIEEIKKAKNAGASLCNLTNGGGRGFAFTKDVRQRMSKIALESWTAEKRESLRERMKGNQNTKGRFHTEEYKKSLSAKLKGRKKPEGFSEKLRVVNLGKKRSAEARAAMSLAAKKRGPNNEMMGYGINNISADKNIYTFTNINTGEVRQCTRPEMAWVGKNVRSLFVATGRLMSYKGWSVSK